MKVKRLITMKDRLYAGDCSFLRGEMIFGTGRHFVDYTDPFGRRARRTEFDKILHRGHNIVPIGGYQYVFDKMFNIGIDQETTLRVGNLNDEAPMMKIGVPRGQYESQEYGWENNQYGTKDPYGPFNISPNHFIFGFMIGDGGAKEDNITPIAPDYKNRCLYHPIPFRMDNDGEAITPGKYYGKQTINGDNPVTSYYIKTFDDPVPHIVHAWATDNPAEFVPVTDTVFSSTSSTPIESYAEINLSLSDMDGRGYFTTDEGSTPRVNEFALVAGWKNLTLDDYENLVMITHFTRPSLSLAEGDEIEAIYRIYAR